MTVDIHLTEEDIRHAVRAYVAQKKLGLVIKEIKLKATQKVGPEFAHNISATVTCEEQPPNTFGGRD